jgi:hypothetical protein
MNYYQKFVPNYAKIAEPLTQLMHKNKNDIEIRNRRMHFTLKKSLNETTHLRILNSTCKRYWKLTHQICRCMLVSDQEWATETHSLSFKKLSESEKRYEVHDKELLVIVKALQDWRSYLQILRSYSDLHKSQEFEKLCNNKTVELTTGCWAEQLVNYEFQIHYKRVMRMMKQTLWVNSLIMKKWRRFTLKFWVKMTKKFSQKA